MRLLILILLISSMAWAQTDPAHLANKYKKIKGDLLTNEEEKRKVLAELFKLTLGMKRINKRRDRLMNEKHFVEGRIEQTTERLNNLRGQLGGQRERMRRRLRALYKFNGQSTMRLIFSSQTPTELDRNLKILKILADKDYSLIREYEKNLKTYSSESRKLKHHKNRLLGIESELKKQEEILIGQQREKNRLVEGFDREALVQILRLERIREQSSRLEQANLNPAYKIGKSFFEARGSLIQPVEGRIVQRFGVLKDRQFNVQLRFKGVFISANINKDVQSVFPGEVLFSGNVDGFGNTVIVGHGDHYYTVYANASEVLKEVGEAVEAGTIIARSGKGWQNYGPGLYFEIRHFSDFLDPAEWLDKNDNQLVSMNFQ